MRKKRRLSAAKGKVSVSLRGKIRNIGKEKLDEIFEKNTYMQSIYPGDTRDALEVFCLHCGRCAEICPKQTIEKRG